MRGVSGLYRFRNVVTVTTTPFAPFRRYLSSDSETSDSTGKIVAAPMTYITGEEMSHYTAELVKNRWIEPYVDTSAWEFFDLSCVNRDQTKDQVLTDAVESGKRLCAIFKEPTITPNAAQVKRFGLSQAWGSPNGAMRRGWNGITISRDTIHIEGIQLGFKRKVLFERHAVGGEYAAGWKSVGAGQLNTIFTSEDGSTTIVDSRKLHDKSSVCVVYDNPLDNVYDLAHHFFRRCLDEQVTPYVVTKKTVFKWQEGFWQIMKEVFDEHYKNEFAQTDLLDACGGELTHLISDAATMQIIRWTGGGFGMAAHNYDGDMLTDEISQVHRSPGFITSNLVGKRKDGVMIKEFEASHGTVTDLYEAMLRGEETSMNPLGMVEALIGAMQHAATLQLELGTDDASNYKNIIKFTDTIRTAMHDCMRNGYGTRDLCGPSGLTTEGFIDVVAGRLENMDSSYSLDTSSFDDVQAVSDAAFKGEVDSELIQARFDEYDTDGNGTIDLQEFEAMMIDLGIAPLRKS